MNVDRTKEESNEVAELRRLLGWVYHRSRHGCFSFKRSQRDGALSDINYWTADFAECWQPPGGRSAARDRIWCGESP